MSGRTLVVLIGGAALCAALVPSASAGPAASRVVDRTFACETGYVGGIYQATVQSYWSVPPQVRRRTPSAAVVTSLTNGFTLRTASPFGYPQLRALGATKRAELAISTLAGKPIVYASIAGAETARPFTATDCQED